MKDSAITEMVSHSVTTKRKTAPFIQQSENVRLANSRILSHRYERWNPIIKELKGNKNKSDKPVVHHSGTPLVFIAACGGGITSVVRGIYTIWHYASYTMWSGNANEYKNIKGENVSIFTIATLSTSNNSK
jgi:hypothetical protein